MQGCHWLLNDIKLPRDEDDLTCCPPNPQSKKTVQTLPWLYSQISRCTLEKETASHRRTSSRVSIWSKCNSESISRDKGFTFDQVTLLKAGHVLFLQKSLQMIQIFWHLGVFCHLDEMVQTGLGFWKKKWGGATLQNGKLESRSAFHWPVHKNRPILVDSNCMNILFKLSSNRCDKRCGQHHQHLKPSEKITWCKSRALGELFFFLPFGK